MEARKNHEGNGSLDRKDIALRAYAIYVDEGCPTGRELDHWQQAESQLLAEQTAQGVDAPTRKNAKARGRSRKQKKPAGSSRKRAAQ